MRSTSAQNVQDRQDYLLFAVARAGRNQHVPQGYAIE
jgi:hypothetical protein